VFLFSESSEELTVSQNKVVEALSLFETLGNSKYFEDTTMVICFTRMDVFKRKIVSGMSPIIGPWDFDGVSADVAAAQAYFTKKFEDLAPHRHPLRIHYLDATNTDDIRIVLADVFGESSFKSPSDH
jgi:guanine nucleotide-binding protein subunit alpha